MPLTTAPLLAAAILLALAGVGKLAHPRPAAVAMRSAGLPGNVPLVQLLALGELAVGTAAVLWASPATTALLAVAYGAFAVFTFKLAHVHGAEGSCGCFGESSTPAHAVHVAINSIVAVVALIGLWFKPAHIFDVLESGAGQATAIVIATLTTVGCMYVALTTLPELLTAARVPDGDRSNDDLPRSMPIQLSTPRQPTIGTTGA